MASRIHWAKRRALDIISNVPPCKRLNRSHLGRDEQLAARSEARACGAAAKPPQFHTVGIVKTAVPLCATIRQDAESTLGNLPFRDRHKHLYQRRRMSSHEGSNRIGYPGCVRRERVSRQLNISPGRCFSQQTGLRDPVCIANQRRSRRTVMNLGMSRVAAKSIGVAAGAASVFGRMKSQRDVVDLDLIGPFPPGRIAAMSTRSGHNRSLRRFRSPATKASSAREHGRLARRIPAAIRLRPLSAPAARVSGR